MDKRDVKAGDIIRLTDPISNGEIVRIDNVDEHGYVEFIGGSQYANFEQIPCEFEAQGIENGLHDYYQTLSDVISDLESITGVKLYPESAVLHYKHEAEVEEKEHAYYEQARKEARETLKRYVYGFDNVIEAIETAVENGTSNDDINTINKMLSEMGSDKTIEL